MRALRTLPFLLLAALPALVHADVTVTPVVTIKDAQADFTAAKYPECLQKIQSILTGVTKPAAPEKAALLLLKAECLMQQKKSIIAAEAFTAAGEAYTHDQKIAATALATATLIHKSQSLQYTPKTGNDKSPLPIVDPAARPAALKALYTDELAADEATYKTFKPGKVTLAGIVDFAPSLDELTSLELAMTGANAKTEAMQKTLATDAKTALDAAIAKLNKDADTIAASAATMVTIQPPANNPARTGGRNGGARAVTQAQPQKKEKGLTDSDKTSLKSLLDTAEKIPPAIKTLTHALATDKDFYKTQSTEAASIKKKIDGILAGNFKAKG